MLMVFVLPEAKSGTLAVTTQAPHPAWLQLILVPLILRFIKTKLIEILKLISTTNILYL